MVLPNISIESVRVSCGWAHTTAVLGLESHSITNLQVTPEMALTMAPKHRWFDPCGWFVVRDLDGICSQLLGGLTQMLLTVQLLVTACGMPPSVALDGVIPAMGLAYLLGNGFFWAQGLRMKFAERRIDVTSQIHGVNIVLLYAFALLVMKPVYDETGDFEKAWGAGCFAGFMSGLMQLVRSGDDVHGPGCPPHHHHTTDSFLMMHVSDDIRVDVIAFNERWQCQWSASW